MVAGLELWEIVLIGGAIGVVATVVWGPPVHQWFVRVPEVVASPALAIATSVLASVVENVVDSVRGPENDGGVGEAIRDQLVLGVPALTVVVLALFNTIVRTRQRQSLRVQHDQEIDRVRERHREERDRLEEGHRQELDGVRRVNRQEWYQFVGYELEKLLFATGKVLSLPASEKRSEWIGSTKTVAVTAAQEYVGRRTQRVRACLYGHDETAKRLSPMPGPNLCYGGEDECTRQFGEDNPIYRSIVIDHERVVMLGISEEEARRHNLDYGNFIAYPIQVRGQDTVLGALVVDSPDSGDLDDMVAVGKVRILAALLSAPLFLESQAGAR